MHPIRTISGNPMLLASILMIFMQMQEKPNTAYPNYTIYSTYYQGSTNFVNQKRLTLVEEFLSFMNAKKSWA